MTDSIAILDPAQFKEAITILKEIAHPQYTLTGAQDWGMLLAMFSVIAFLLVIVIAMIGFLWNHMQNSVDKNFEAVWAEIRRCQGFCWDGKERRFVKRESSGQ